MPANEWKRLARPGRIETSQCRPIILPAGSGMEMLLRPAFEAKWTTPGVAGILEEIAGREPS